MSPLGPGTTSRRTPDVESCFPPAAPPRPVRTQCGPHGTADDLTRLASRKGAGPDERPLTRERGVLSRWNGVILCSRPAACSRSAASPSCSPCRQPAAGAHVRRSRRAGASRPRGAEPSGVVQLPAQRQRNERAAFRPGDRRPRGQFGTPAPNATPNGAPRRITTGPRAPAASARRGCRPRWVPRAGRASPQRA